MPAAWLSTATRSLDRRAAQIALPLRIHRRPSGHRGMPRTRRDLQLPRSRMRTARGGRELCRRVTPNRLAPSMRTWGRAPRP